MSKTNGSLSTTCASVDEQGRLVLPTELLNRFGFVPGASVRIDEEMNGLHLHRPTTGLAKVYIALRGQCNLKCRTCVRNSWEEPMGWMSTAIFERLLAGLRELESPPTVFFSGFGEPLFHPEIVEMVSAVKAVGCRVELISNVIQNIDIFRASRRSAHRPTPEIGIAFVAMKHNISDLPALLTLSTRLGASRYFVTILLPYSQDIYSEVLYSRVIHEINYLPSKWVPHLDRPLSAKVFKNLITPPTPSAPAMTYPKRTKKIVLKAPSPPAAAACWRRV